MGREGLQEYWGEVISSIERLGSRYRRVNRLISLGLDVKLRRLGVLMSLPCSGRVLDAGAADGSLTLEIWRLLGGRSLIVMLDPLESMMRIARDRLSISDVEMVVGVLESCPFRDSSFGAVYMSFSLRDVRDLRGSLASLRDIVQGGGSLTIIDLGKPSGRLSRAVMGAYWRIVAPLLAMLASPDRGREVSMIYPTYLRLPTNDRLLRLLSHYFSLERVRYILRGAAIILTARKLD